MVNKVETRINDGIKVTVLVKNGAVNVGRFESTYETVDENGTKSISETPVDRELDYEEVRRKFSQEQILGLQPEYIWKMYKSYRSNDSVVRSGSGLCGVYDFDPKYPFNDNYIESDTMHSTAVEELAWDIFRFYPDLVDHDTQWRIIQLLRYHDLGESSDCPDDGSRDHDEKTESEMQIFINKIRFLDPILQDELIKDMVVFENMDAISWADPKQAFRCGLAKVFDKADALVGALLYESQGRVGTLSYKSKHFGRETDRDRAYADEIGDDRQADVWTAHLIDQYGKYPGADICIAITQAASIDVRGLPFTWLPEFAKKRGVILPTTKSYLVRKHFTE